jgi:hypothetical protein
MNRWNAGRLSRSKNAGNAGARAYQLQFARHQMFLRLPTLCCAKNSLLRISFFCGIIAVMS